MATEYILPSTGNQISMNDIIEIMYGAAAGESQYSLDYLTDQAGLDESWISYFSSYKVKCDVTTVPATFVGSIGTSTVNNQVLTVVCLGVSGNFTTSSSDDWINWADGSTSVNVWMDQNNTGSTRSGSIRVKHDNNPDCYDDVTVLQAAAPIRTIRFTLQ